MSTIGKSTWFDIPVTDMESAQEFYSKLLGWKYQAMNDQYFMIMVGEETIGGLREAEGKRVLADTPVIYFTVAKLDESVKMATGLGAELIGETVDLQGDGFFQWFKDPDENVLALWSEQR